MILHVLAMASLAMASDGVSINKGKELFTSGQLGTNGKSCNLCHPGGKGLVKVTEYDDGQLGEIINQCIKNALKGKTLDPTSVEIKSLVMYIKSLTEK
jgi:thiosulfate dehydrogenase